VYRAREFVVARALYFTPSLKRRNCDRRGKTPSVIFKRKLIDVPAPFPPPPRGDDDETACSAVKRDTSSRAFFNAAEDADGWVDEVERRRSKRSKAVPWATPEGERRGWREEEDGVDDDDDEDDEDPLLAPTADDNDEDEELDADCEMEDDELDDDWLLIAAAEEREEVAVKWVGYTSLILR
jgi:hypothetical protein